MRSQPGLRWRLPESGARIAAPGTAGGQPVDGILPEGGARSGPRAAPVGPAAVVGAVRPHGLQAVLGCLLPHVLGELLGELGVDALVLAGYNMPNCPRTCIVQAPERDFRVALVRDALSRVTDSALTELAGTGRHSAHRARGSGCRRVPGASADGHARCGTRRADCRDRHPPTRVTPADFTGRRHVPDPADQTDGSQDRAGGRYLHRMLRPGNRPGPGSGRAADLL